MIKVCFPLEGLNNSGGLRVITDIANYLAEKDIIVDVIVPDYRSDHFYQFSEKINLIIVNTNSIFGRRLSYLYYFIINSANKNYYFSFATGYKTPFCIFLSKLLNFSNTKIVYLIQHYEISSQINFNKKQNKFSKFLKTCIANIGYFLPSIKIAVSDWIKLQINDPKINIIPNGINLNVFKVSLSPEERDFFSIGVVGSNKPIKGYNYLIEAISNLKSDLRDKIKLFVLSNENIELPENIISQQINPKTSNEIANFYNSCNVFIFGSYEEGFGLPPLEAMASGCAVISSDCGGVRTFLDEFNSNLFIPGNSEQLTKIIEFLFDNPDKMNQIRIEGILRSKEFSSEMMLSSYYKLLIKYIN